VSPLWWAALLAAATYVGLVAAGRRGRVRGIKVLPALFLVAVVAPAHPLAAAALVASAAGDGFLLDKERFFLHGLVSFLVAHVLFVPAFLGASGTLPSPALLAPIACLALALLVYLRPRKPILMAAVPLYTLALVAMVGAATTLGPLGLAGGLSFLVSDAVLSIRVFKRDFPGADVIVMVTYYGAILSLAAALAA
jgi:uncharacterized membrane protein YhhN